MEMMYSIILDSTIKYGKNIFNIKYGNNIFNIKVIYSRLNREIIFPISNMKTSNIKYENQIKYIQLQNGMIISNIVPFINDFSSFPALHRLFKKQQTNNNCCLNCTKVNTLPKRHYFCALHLVLDSFRGCKTKF